MVYINSNDSVQHFDSKLKDPLSFHYASYFLVGRARNLQTWEQKVVESGAVVEVVAN